MDTMGKANAESYPAPVEAQVFMKEVLVVDDSATMRRMVMSSLGAIPQVSFQEAANGLEAIERLALEAIDLMILDLNMPDMHGMEVVAFVQKHATLRKVPIIVLTTRGDDTSREAVLAAGATRFFSKPFEPAALAAEVRRLLFGDVNGSPPSR